MDHWEVVTSGRDAIEDIRKASDDVLSLDKALERVGVSLNASTGVKEIALLTCNLYFTDLAEWVHSWTPDFPQSLPHPHCPVQFDKKHLTIFGWSAR